MFFFFFYKVLSPWEKGQEQKVEFSTWRALGRATHACWLPGVLVLRNGETWIYPGGKKPEALKAIPSLMHLLAQGRSQSGGNHNAESGQVLQVTKY